MKFIANLVAGSAVSLCCAKAAILLRYDFETPGSEFNNKTSGTGASGSVLARGAALDTDDGISTTISPTGGGLQSYFARGASLKNAAGTSTANSFPTSQTQGNYLTFTVTADPGKLLNLTSITFDTGKLAGNVKDFRIIVTSTAADTYADRLPLSNSSTSLANVLESNQNEIKEIGTGLDTSWGTNSNVTVSLAAAAFQGVSTATFRIYAFTYDDSAGAASNIIHFDNFILNGTVIPEASSALFGILGFASLVAKRRR